MGPSNALALQVASLRRMHGKMLGMDDVSFGVKRGRVVCIISASTAPARPLQSGASKGYASRSAGITS